MPDRFERLRANGQAVWLRHLRGALVASGRLEALVRAHRITGIDCELDILSAAARYGGAGVAPAVAVRNATPDELVEAYLVQEARLVADAMMPIYDGCGGRDGFVSVDVIPLEAADAEAMSAAVYRMSAAIGLPNVMFNVPAGESGLAVLEAMTADGFHIHVGPLFSVDSVCRATEAFVRGLRRHLASGENPCGVASLASLRLSRLDATVDNLLIGQIHEGSGDSSATESLIGSCAVATAKVACRRQRRFLDRELDEELRGAGPAMMRLMWSGTASKDPRFPDLRYVDSLIGPDTVVSLSLASLRAFAAHGRARGGLGRNVDEAADILDELGGLGIDLEAVGRELERSALERRVDQWRELGATLAAAGAVSTRVGAVGGAPMARDGAREAVIRRLWSKDASLWSDDPNESELIRNRLGWLELPEAMLDTYEPLQGFARQIAERDVEYVVLLGMGGSSLCAAMFRKVFDSDRLIVLDSTVPGEVRTVGATIDPARTLFLVSSKSGDTIEVRALADHFYAQATPMLENPGDRFVAVTDPGSPLEQLALERGFDRLWLAPPDVGGRFSALSTFGLLPMAIMGIDLDKVLRSARRMAAGCESDMAASSNPGAVLASALYEAHRAGRDKLTFVSSPVLAPFGAWAEQLVAESTGKNGIGLVPIADEPPGAAEEYAADRIFVSLRLADESDATLEELLERLAAAGHPVIHAVLDDRHELGAEMFRWEFAISVAAAMLRINPFDQPDVQASKEKTAAFLTSRRDGAPVESPPPLDAGTGWAVFGDLGRDPELASRHDGAGIESWLKAHLGRARVPDYVGLQAFVTADPMVRRGLDAIRTTIRKRLGVATTMGWGPAFLHSTGQLHKGGPDTGLFVQITADSPADVDCPGLGVTFGNLVHAQARGDLETLQQRGRRVLRIHLSEADAGIEALATATERALSGCRRAPPGSSRRRETPS